MNPIGSTSVMEGLSAVNKYTDRLLDHFGLMDFDLYKNNFTGHRSHYEYSWALPFERSDTAAKMTIYFQTHWHYSIYVSIIYYGIIRLIQFGMRNRPPFQLRETLILWNGMLAVFTVVSMIRFAEMFLSVLWTHGFRYATCRVCSDRDVAAFWGMAFGWAKVFELGDTLFIVLRKKPLIFLHYYHHAAVLIFSSHTTAEQSAPSQWYGFMNMIAHSVMYTYYAYTAYACRRPARWVSMSVTTIQTMQMLCGVLISFYVLFVKLLDPDYPCQQSFANLYLAFFLYFTFGVLFVQFFVSAYLRKSPKKGKVE